MPAVLDALGGPAWLRGCLPMLNRFGQSVPPLLSSSFVTQSRFKKWILAFCSALMGLSFIALAICLFCFVGTGTRWLPGVFLLLYAVFFCSTGINQLSLSTLIGKLVPIRRRGLLMLCGTTIGSATAVLCAWYLLRMWLTPETGNFGAIFLFAGVSFVIGAVVVSFLREEPDESEQPPIGFREIMRSALTTLKTNRNFRTLAFVAAMFGMSMTLFPHYQALGRERLGISLDRLMVFVVAQNIGMALFSIPAGRMADWFGNRIVLRVVILAICAAPILALTLSRMGTFGSRWFFFVFVIVGLTPVTMRIFANFALELGDRSEQPRLLGVLSLCMAGPAVFSSTLLGLLLDYAGFEIVFTIVIVCLVVGWLVTFLLEEPRASQ